MKRITGTVSREIGRNAKIGTRASIVQWMSTGSALEDKTIFKQINIKRTVESELLVNLSSRGPSWPNSDTSSRTFEPGAEKLKLSTGGCGQSHFETATVTTSLNTNRNQAVVFLSQVDGRSILRSPAWNFSSEAASDLMSDKVIAFWRYYRRLEIPRRGWGRDTTKNIIKTMPLRLQYLVDSLQCYFEIR